MIVWKIQGMTVKPSADGLTDVVSTVRWSARYENTVDGKTYIGADTRYGTVTLPSPNTSEFIVYPELTEAQVLEWIWANGVDKTAVESALNSNTEFYIKDQPPVPWQVIPPV